MRGGSAAVGVVLLLVAVALALMPFRDGEVRCGPPLFGAEASLDDAPSPELGIGVVVVGCTDDAVGRLLLSGALVVAGISTTAVGLWLRSRPRRDEELVAPGAAAHPF
jgi:hypothetical protein